MSIHTSALTSSAPTATSIGKRTVADTIRHLFPGNPTLSLVQSGAVGEDMTKSKALIKKRETDNVKFENFNYTPMAVLFTVSAANSATEYEVSSADGLCLKMCLINTANRTVCRIGAISTLTLTVTSIGGTAFSADEGDTLLALAPVYADNSSSPYILMNSEDNLYNILEISRFPSAISASNKGNPFYGKDYWARVRKQVVMEGLRKVENSAVWSERASSTNLTTTDGTLADAFRTTRGLWHWAVGGGATFEANGSMTHEKFVKNLPLAMNDTVGAGDKIIGFVSRSQFADMCMWANQNLMVTEQGTLKKFGVTSKVFVTSGPEIEVIVHDSFNRGSLSSCALFFNPEYVNYVFKKSRDFHPVLGIQNNDVDGVEDDFLGEWGVGVDDGGNSMTYVTGW
jgi:hypothetical protein